MVGVWVWGVGVASALAVAIYILAAYSPYSLHITMSTKPLYTQKHKHAIHMYYIQRLKSIVKYHVTTHVRKTRYFKNVNVEYVNVKTLPNLPHPLDTPLGKLPYLCSHVTLFTGMGSGLGILGVCVLLLLLSVYLLAVLCYRWNSHNLKYQWTKEFI